MIERVTTDPGGNWTGALRKFVAMQWPSGLHAFPTGGIPLILGEGMEIHLCERGTRQFRRLAVIMKPEYASHEIATPRVVGWEGDGLVVGLHDYGPRKDDGTAGTLWIRVRTIGVIDTLGATPFAQRDVDSAPLAECRPALNSLWDLTETPLGPQTDTMVFAPPKDSSRTAR